MGITFPCSSRIVMVICASVVTLELASATPRANCPAVERYQQLGAARVSSGTAASCMLMTSRKIAVPPIFWPLTTSAQPTRVLVAVPAVSMVWLLPGCMVPTFDPAASGTAMANPLSFQKFTVYWAGCVSRLTRTMVVFHPPPSAMCEIVCMGGAVAFAVSTNVRGPLLAVADDLDRIGILLSGNQPLVLEHDRQRPRRGERPPGRRRRRQCDLCPCNTVVGDILQNDRGAGIAGRQIDGLRRRLCRRRGPTA